MVENPSKNYWVSPALNNLEDWLNKNKFDPLVSRLSTDEIWEFQLSQVIPRFKQPRPIGISVFKRPIGTKITLYLSVPEGIKDDYSDLAKSFDNPNRNLSREGDNIVLREPDSSNLNWPVTQLSTVEGEETKIIDNARLNQPYAGELLGIYKYDPRAELAAVYDAEHAESWFDSDNLILGGKPADMLGTEREHNMLGLLNQIIMDQKYGAFS